MALSLINDIELIFLCHFQSESRVGFLVDNFLFLILFYQFLITFNLLSRRLHDGILRLLNGIQRCANSWHFELGSLSFLDINNISLRVVRRWSHVNFARRICMTLSSYIEKFAQSTLLYLNLMPLLSLTSSLFLHVSEWDSLWFVFHFYKSTIIIFLIDLQLNLVYSPH